jgi:hypothetical protein
MKVLIDVVVHSEHVKVIQCDFKPGSVERSIDLDKERYTLVARNFTRRYQ